MVKLYAPLLDAVKSESATLPHCCSQWGTAAETFSQFYLSLPISYQTSYRCVVSAQYGSDGSVSIIASTLNTIRIQISNPNPDHYIDWIAIGY